MNSNKTNIYFNSLLRTMKGECTTFSRNLNDIKMIISIELFLISYDYLICK